MPKWDLAILFWLGFKLVIDVFTYIYIIYRLMK